MARNGNGNGHGNGRPGLSASTTIPLGVAAALLLGAFGGIWWASSLSAKVDFLTNDLNGMRLNVNGMTNDIANIKKSVDRIEWATSSDNKKK